MAIRINGLTMNFVSRGPFNTAKCRFLFEIPGLTGILFLGFLVFGNYSAIFISRQKIVGTPVFEVHFDKIFPF